MNKEPEIIDSTNMEILSEFSVEYDDEEIASPSSINIKKCFIKAFEGWVVFATNSKGLNEAIGNVAFERGSFKQLNQELEAVLSGKLYEEKNRRSDFSKRKRQNDYQRDQQLAAQSIC